MSDHPEDELQAHATATAGGRGFLAPLGRRRRRHLQFRRIKGWQSASPVASAALSPSAQHSSSPSSSAASPTQEAREARKERQQQTVLPSQIVVMAHNIKAKLKAAAGTGIPMATAATAAASLARRSKRTLTRRLSGRSTTAMSRHSQRLEERDAQPLPLFAGVLDAGGAKFNSLIKGLPPMPGGSGWLSKELDTFYLLQLTLSSHTRVSFVLGERRALASSSSLPINQALPVTDARELAIVAAHYLALRSLRSLSSGIIYINLAQAMKKAETSSVTVALLHALTAACNTDSAGASAASTVLGKERRRDGKTAANSSSAASAVMGRTAGATGGGGAGPSKKLLPAKGKGASRSNSLQSDGTDSLQGELLAQPAPLHSSAASKHGEHSEDDETLQEMLALAAEAEEEGVEREGAKDELEQMREKLFAQLKTAQALIILDCFSVQSKLLQSAGAGAGPAGGAGTAPAGTIDREAEIETLLSLPDIYLQTVAAGSSAESALARAILAAKEQEAELDQFLLSLHESTHYLRVQVILPRRLRKSTQEVDGEELGSLLSHRSLALTLLPSAGQVHFGPPISTVSTVIKKHAPAGIEKAESMAAGMGVTGGAGAHTLQPAYTPYNVQQLGAAAGGASDTPALLLPSWSTEPVKYSF